jgi:hypothetical protein
MEPVQPPPPQTTVFIYIENLLGIDAQAGPTSLSIQNVQAFTPPGSGVVVTPSIQVIPCDSYGYCSADVVASVDAGVAYYFTAQYVDQYAQIQTYVFGWAQIPYQTSLDLSLVTFTKNSDGSN